LVTTSACHAEGRGFESRRFRHKYQSRAQSGRAPVLGTGGFAGSNPATLTTNNLSLRVEYIVRVHVKTKDQGVAQSGRVSGLDSRGRRFESYRPDHIFID
jgi:hypothetical protein